MKELVWMCIHYLLYVTFKVHKPFKGTVDLLFKQTKASYEPLESLVECEKQTSGKGKGSNLKLGKSSLPIRVTLAWIWALKALYAITEDSSFVSNIDSLVFPSKIRSVNNWTRDCTEKEDKQLLKSKLDMLKSWKPLRNVFFESDRYHFMFRCPEIWCWYMGRSQSWFRIGTKHQDSTNIRWYYSTGEFIFNPKKFWPLS